MTDFRDLAKQARTVHEVRLAKDESRHLAKSDDRMKKTARPRWGLVRTHTARA
jgi:hypothetical protein